MSKSYQKHPHKKIKLNPSEKTPEGEFDVEAIVNRKAINNNEYLYEVDNVFFYKHKKKTR